MLEDDVVVAWGGDADDDAAWGGDADDDAAWGGDADDDAAWGGDADDDAAGVGGFVDVEVNTTDDDTVGGRTGGAITVGSPVNNGRYNNVQFHQFTE